MFRLLRELHSLAFSYAERLKRQRKSLTGSSFKEKERGFVVRQGLIFFIMAKK